jgi:hypothetical protein
MAVHNWIKHFNCFEERLCGSGFSYVSRVVSFIISLTSVFLFSVAVEGHRCT